MGYYITKYILFVPNFNRERARASHFYIDSCVTIANVGNISIKSVECLSDGYMGNIIIDINTTHLILWGQNKLCILKADETNMKILSLEQSY